MNKRSPELCVRPWRPRVQHLRDDMGAFCGVYYFSLVRVRMGQIGDGLPLCGKCAKEEHRRKQETEYWHDVNADHAPGKPA